MAFRALVLCVSALLVQSIAGRCVTPPSCGCSGGVKTGSVGYNTGITEITSRSLIPASNFGCNVNVGNVGYNTGITEIETVSVSAPAVVVGSVAGPALASSGGAFITTSVSPVAPTGIRVDSTNELYGELLASGTLPYLTAVAFEGSFANDGVASVAYGCGDGEIAIKEVIGGGAVASGPSYGGSILAGPSYGSAVLSAPSCASTVLAAPSCASTVLAGPTYGFDVSSSGCGCNKYY